MGIAPERLAEPLYVDETDRNIIVGKLRVLLSHSRDGYLNFQGIRADATPANTMDRHSVAMNDECNIGLTVSTARQPGTYKRRYIASIRRTYMSWAENDLFLESVETFGLSTNGTQDNYRRAYDHTNGRGQLVYSSAADMSVECMTAAEKTDLDTNQTVGMEAEALNLAYLHSHHIPLDAALDLMMLTNFCLAQVQASGDNDS